jgi:ribosome-associated translation inhibitor RaiA
MQTANGDTASSENPISIHFHGIERSAALEQLVRQKLRKLAQHFGRITSCRIVLEAPHRTPRKPKVFQIKIELGVPRRRPIVVCHERAGSHAHAELPLMVRASFDAAVRKLDGMSRRIGNRPRLERGRRRPRRSSGDAA